MTIVFPPQRELADSAAHRCDLLVFDGSNIAHRAFHAIPAELSTSRGEPTNVLLGFASLLIAILRDYEPHAFAVAWDRKPRARLELLAIYKAHRREPPEQLRAQMPLLPELVSALGGVNVSADGWEADDVMATLATRVAQEGGRVCLVTSDRDAYQLVSSSVCILAAAPGRKGALVYTPERVREKTGVPPELISDYLGLRGDPGDGIPGVPGIGEKSAAALLAQYGSLENVLASIDCMPPGRRRENLREHAEQARISKQLATVRRDLELGIDAGSLPRHEPDMERLRAFCERWDLRSVLRRVEGRSG